MIKQSKLLFGGAMTIPSVYNETLTTLETLDYLIKEINRVIKSMNIVIDNNNQIQEILDNFIETLDLEKAVKDVLQQYIDDGTLEEIINEELFKELNDKVAQLQTDLDAANVKINNNTTSIESMASTIATLDQTVTTLQSIVNNINEYIQAIIEVGDNDANFIATKENFIRNDKQVIIVGFGICDSDTIATLNINGTGSFVLYDENENQVKGSDLSNQFFNVIIEHDRYIVINLKNTIKLNELEMYVRDKVILDTTLFNNGQGLCVRFTDGSMIQGERTEVTLSSSENNPTGTTLYYAETGFEYYTEFYSSPVVTTSCNQPTAGDLYWIGLVSTATSNTQGTLVRILSNSAFTSKTFTIGYIAFGLWKRISE